MWQVLYKGTYVYYRNLDTGFIFSITQILNNGITLYSGKNSSDPEKFRIMGYQDKIDYYDILEISNTVLGAIDQADSIRIDKNDVVIKLILDHEWFYSIRLYGEFISVIKGLKRGKVLEVHDMEVLKLRLYERFGDILSEFKESVS